MQVLCWICNTKTASVPSVRNSSAVITVDFLFFNESNVAFFLSIRSVNWIIMSVCFNVGKNELRKEIFALISIIKVVSWSLKIKPTSLFVQNLTLDTE